MTLHVNLILYQLTLATLICHEMVIDYSNL
jgi:hypothetical protein